MRGLMRWWNGLPTAGRAGVGLVGGGAIFGIVGLSAGWTAGLVVTAILVGAVLLFLLVRAVVQAVERRRGQGLSAKLWSRMSGGGGGLDATSAELSIRQDMQRRWKDVHETLRERRYDYYSFPWYLILGAAQSGKTTTIQQSNQEFPIGAEPVVDYGGTKGCNWFFTNKAILIDTAGRYVEHLGEDDADWDTMLKRDQEEWETFLRLLKEERNRSPINGVIVTIKLEDVLEQDPRRQKKIAESLRKALLHIEEQLEIRVPVYVLVTMMDLLVGFVDFFSNLPGLTDRSLFGWSRGGAFDKPFETSEFEPAFASLVAKVDGLLLEFLETQAGRGESGADWMRIDRMMAFPDEFRSLGPKLQALLDAVFKKSAYNEQHFFRGVYFTSGRQEGRPVMNACLDLVGDGAGVIEEEDVALSSGGGNKAYFIADLYEEKVFHEAGLVRMTKRASASQRMKKRAYIGIAAVLAVAASLWVTQEIVRFGTLRAYPHEALTALAQRDFVRDDVSLRSSVLTGTEGLEGLALHLAELRSDEYVEATLLGRADLDDTYRVVLDAYRKIYAEKVFATVLDDFCADQEGRELDDWAACRDLTHVLLTLRSMGRGETALTVDGLRGDLLPTMARLHDTAGDDAPVAYEMLAELAQTLGPGDASEPLRELRGLAERRYELITGLLRSRVLSFWTAWLEALERPFDDMAAREPTVERVEAFWRWQRLRVLDGAVASTLGDLTRLLDGVRAAGRDLDGFRRACATPWRSAFSEVTQLRAQLDRHVDSTRFLASSVAAACDELDDEFESLEAIKDQPASGPAEVAVQAAIRAVGLSLQGARGQLETWVRPERQEVIRIEQRDPVAAGAATAALERGQQALGLGVTGYAFENRLGRTLWGRLVQIDALVAYDPLTDPAFDPGRREFWDMRHAEAFDRWQNQQVDQVDMNTASGDPTAVRRLLEVAGAAALVDELRHAKRSAYLRALTESLGDTAGRDAFLARIDTAQVGAGGRTLSVHARLDAHPANADVAAALGEVVATLRRTAADHAAHLDQGALNVSQNLSLLYKQYLERIFTPFWQGGFVELGREIGKLPPVPGAGWTGFVAWKEQALSARGNAFDGALDLARFVGAQVDRFGELAKRAGAPVLTDVEPASRLWRYYRADAGSSAAGERLLGTARALSAALVALGDQSASMAPYDRLKAVQRDSPIYEGLMGPARLRHEWREKVDDPILEALIDTATPVRAALGQLASELFVQNWTKLGPEHNGPAEPLLARFPFTKVTDLTEDDDRLASADLVAAFFGDAHFRQLAEVVYPHLTPMGPTSFSLYGVEFPSPAHAQVFRRCVELRDLCSFDEPSVAEVPVEIFDSRGLLDGTPEEWSNAWVFDLGQDTPNDVVTLNFSSFVDSPLVDDFAPRWTPRRSVKVHLRDTRGDGNNPWRYTGPLHDAPHWTNLLLFVYANPRADDSEVRNDFAGESKDGVRFIKVTLQRNQRKVTKVLGVRMPGMPDELPDLGSVYAR